MTPSEQNRENVTTSVSGARRLETFDSETWLTHKVLAVLPEEKFHWRPHEKSMPLGVLAEHTSKLLVLARYILENPGLDVSVNAPPHTNLEFSRIRDILEQFENLTAACRALIAGTTEDALNIRWRFGMAEKTLIHRLRPDVINTAVLLHMAHHRGQLTVYLQLLEVPVPALYGPSADASWMISLTASLCNPDDLSRNSYARVEN
jgi:uncharacterized damage-inducible protein DinB